MKELYEEYFGIPQNGKIREKVMICRTVVTVMIIVLCLIAMSITAYAYFSYEVTSGSNLIKAANFNATVSVIGEGEIGIDPSSTDGANTTYTFSADGIYTVTIRNENSTSETGFCILSVGKDKYHTQQIRKNNSIQFTVKVSAGMEIRFINHWGTSSYYGYDNAEKNPHYIKSGNEVDLTLSTIAIGEESEISQTADTEKIHIVKEGENLTRIAAKHGTTIQRIVAYNEIVDARVIFVGQEIKIPPETWEMPSEDAKENTNQ